MRNRIMITYMLLLVAALTIIFVPVAEVSAFWVANLEVSASHSSATILLDGWDRDGGGLINLGDIPRFEDLPFIFGPYDAEGNPNLDEDNNPVSIFVPVGFVFRYNDELRVVWHTHPYTMVFEPWSSHRIHLNLEFEYGVRYRTGSIVTLTDPEYPYGVRWFRMHDWVTWYPPHPIGVNHDGTEYISWAWMEIHPLDYSIFDFFDRTTIKDYTLRLDQVRDINIPLP